VDVIVVGGGPAGTVAAIASARVGASTVLIEQFGYLGGTATASLMACINGFRNQVEPDSTQTVRGIAQEIILELRRLGGLGKSPYKQKEYDIDSGQLSYSYAVDTEKLKYVLMKMCADAGVKLMLHSFFSMPVMEGDRVTGVIAENKSGRQAVMARVVVDATGDGDVAARAGCEFWQTRHDEAKRMGDGLMYRIQFGSARPEGPYACDFGASSVVWGPGIPAIDGTDAAELSRAEVDARLRVFEDFEAKQKERPELADAKVIETPPLLGIRQTRFIEGEYKLTADDAISGRRFEDVIAISSCPIIHYHGYRRYLEHEGYDIPYRCLVPKKVDGLIVAGRCISSEQQPYESHRAMAPIMAIGHAAGAAAGLSALGGVEPRNLKVTGLQKKLIEQGATVRRRPPLRTWARSSRTCRSGISPRGSRRRT
jgi:hypothetical protein